jgi:hypothetical protein
MRKQASLNQLLGISLGVSMTVYPRLGLIVGESERNLLWEAEPSEPYLVLLSSPGTKLSLDRINTISLPGVSLRVLLLKIL